MRLAKPLSFLVLAYPTTVAAANTIHVPGDQPTIQAAIDIAVDGDTVLVAPGTYPEDLEFHGASIEVKSTSGPAVTTIQAPGGTSAVLFDSGEGPDTVLEGFTISGGFNLFGAGVYCTLASPTLRGNVIKSNHAWGGHGGGMGGGIAAFDSAAVIENNLVLDNVGEYTGGGICLVRSQAIVTGNVVAGNDGLVGVGSWGGGIACMYDGSTVRGNTVVGNSADVGGGVLIYGYTTTIRDTIVWGNASGWGGAPVHVGGTGAPAIEYCDVQGGWTGTGNIDQDPQFQNAAGGDFSLLLGSLCVDAGDPASALDPDGTRADMGALPFGQFTATATVRNGSGVNTLLYSPTSTPIVGTTWTATVDTSGHGGTTFSLLFGYSIPSSGLVLGAGELLVDPTSPLLFQDLAVPAGGVAGHSVAVPLDYRLSGLFVPTQALVVGGGPELGNAVDLRLGL